MMVVVFTLVALTHWHVITMLTQVVIMGLAPMEVAPTPSLVTLIHLRGVMMEAVGILVLETLHTI